MIDFLLDLLSFFLPKEKVDAKTLILESPPLNVPRSFEVLGHLVSFVQHPKINPTDVPFAYLRGKGVTGFESLKYFQATLVDPGIVLPRIYTGHTDPWLHYDLRVALGEDPGEVENDSRKKFDLPDCYPEKRLVISGDQMLYLRLLGQEDSWYNRAYSEYLIYILSRDSQERLMLDPKTLIKLERRLPVFEFKSPKITEEE